MLYKDYTTTMLGLKEAIIKNIDTISDRLIIHIKLPSTEHRCPNCGSLTNKIHDYRIQKVTDFSTFFKIIYLFIRKRRYVCTSCNKRFYESSSFFSKYQRMTNRLINHILAELADIQFMANIAKRYHTSIPMVIRKRKTASYSKPDTLPEVMSIYEFKGNVGSKFQCILTDAQNKKAVDILPTRNTDDLFDYFSSFPISIRDKVKFIVMDMSTQFRSIATRLFPKARIIADKFLVCRLANWALEDVRKAEQKNFIDTKRKYFKHNRHVLLKSSKNLSADERIILENLLSNSPKLEKAYYLKEYFSVL